MRKTRSDKGKLKVLRETRVCAAPGCDNTFECKVNCDKRYCRPGHSTIGRKYSKERNEKIGRKNRGKVRSAEANEKNRQAHLGKKQSKESIQKGIETRKKNTLLRGYHHSKETLVKIGASNTGKLKGRKIPKEVLEKRKATRDKHGPYHLSKEHIEKISVFQKQRKHKPTSQETKEKLRTAGLGREVSEETISKLKKISQEYWDNVSLEIAEARIAKALQASRQVTGIRPNKFEASCMLNLARIYPNKFRYTGDGTFLVNRHSPDAYSEELNTVVLFNGTYWHLQRAGLENTVENKRIRQKIESKPFLDAGYTVFFIWEDAIDTIIKLVE